MPVTSAAFEMGKFDTQLLKALIEGRSIPEGTDYQHGERYGIETLRAAVFLRDQHTCIFCGRGIKDKAKLHVHHIGYWKHDRTDRLSNLATACEKCHTPENHKPGGILYGKEPKVKGMADATFMTMIRFRMLEELKAADPDVEAHISYGAKTKVTREKLGIPKSHANDAYCIGNFHPRHRSETEYIRKVRRNDRILQKFYDAVYIDSRDGKEKNGQELTNGRISRNHKKDHENLHPFRSRKGRKGRVTIRRGRTEIKPGTLVRYNKQVMTVHGIHRSRRKNKAGQNIVSVNIEFTEKAADGRKSANQTKCTVLNQSYNTGWKKQTKEVVHNE